MKQTPNKEVKRHIIGYTENGEYYMGLSEGILLGCFLGIIIAIIL